MRQIISWFSWQKVIFSALIVAIIYQSRLGLGEWLIGWDSVMPELDWKLNFTRTVAGAWQEYQGLGLTGGMAHLADLSRMIILWAIDQLVPTNYVRWVWHMGMVALGPIGIWYMGKKLWKWSEYTCLAASVFYLLNLATVQYFFVPYEAFSSFYGFLPWLIAVFLIYLESGERKDLSKVAVAGILATSAFYVQTLFVVYVMILIILSFGYLRNWKRILFGFLVIFSVNSFWLLPVIYGVINGGGLVGIAKINSIASPETALMNSSFGKWQDVMSMRGYWLQYIEWVDGIEWGRLMNQWWEWSKQSWVVYVGLVMFGLSILGSVIAVMKRQVRWTWIVGFVMAYMMVASFNPPLGNIYNYFVEKIPLFGEMFRSAFTKWSVVLALFVSIGIGSFVATVKSKRMSGIIATLVWIGCMGVAWPVLTKGMIFEKMKTETPGEYFNLFKFMDSEPKSSRIAYLPSQDMWSWKYADWGYRGSGFLWYGIEQPILDRAFDVWSPYNEGFYNEFNNSLYECSGISLTLCSSGVSSVLDKYGVRYVLLDESVIAPGQDMEILRIDETKKLAEELGWKQSFQEGFLTVWDRGEQGNNFVSTPASYTWVEGESDKVRRDVAWEEVGHYVTSNKLTQQQANAMITYPFAGLMREEIGGKENKEQANIEYGDENITLRSDLVGVNPARSGLVIPGWKVGDIVRINYRDAEPLPAYTVNGLSGPVFLGKEKPEEGKSHIVARVSDGEEWSEYLNERKYILQGETVKMEVPGEPQIYDFAKVGAGTVGNCDVLKRGVAEKQDVKYSADDRGAVCDYIVMSELDTRLSYLMRMQGENREGRSLKFFLYNTGSKRNDIEYLLGKGTYDQTFSLLPWSFDGTYTLNIETRSFGQYAENTVAPVEVRWLPIQQIAGARIIKSNGETPPASGVPTRDSLGSPVEESPQVRSDLLVIEVKKYGTWLYFVETKNGGLLKLSQGYDEGWVSPYLEHVKVDGWANGWMVPAGEHQIVIFYWPQLLQYLGFVMLGVTIIILVRMKK